MNLRDSLRRAGLRVFRTPYQDTAVSYTDTTMVTEQKTRIFKDDQSSFVEHRADGLPPENDDPEKVRIHRTWKTRSERRIANLKNILEFLRVLFSRAAPGLMTEQERETLAENKRRQALDRSLRSQAMLAAGIMRNVLARLGICSWYDKEGKRRITHKVEFVYCEYSPTCFKFYVDAGDLPWRVSIEDLTNNPNVTQTLSAALRHPVVCETVKDIMGGTDAIITVEIAGTNDIQNHIDFRDCLKLIPDDATPLTFPLGVSRNGIKERRAVEGMPHLIIAGETGGGKSNMMHVIISTVVARNRPEDVQLLLIDLKYNGLELNRYETVPHVLKGVIPEVPNGIATNLPEALAVLKYANAMCADRGEKLVNGKEKYQNIEQWNKRHRTRKFSRVLVIIDELAEMMDKSDAESKEEKSIITQCRQNVKQILRLARSQGVHLIGCTQSLDKTVMGSAFKVNTAGRICFSVSDVPSSILVVNNGDAVNMAPAGRGIYKRGPDRVMIQTPFITPVDIEEVVANAICGTQITKLHGAAYTPQDIVNWAVEENDGALGQRDVYYHLNRDYPAIEMAELQNILMAMEGQTYTVFDYEYRIIAGSGRRPRRAERIVDDQMSTS